MNVDYKIIDEKKRWVRNCPRCKKEIYYEYLKNRNYFEKRKTLCQSCNKSGENHPFYGKHHTKETREKMSKIGKTLIGNKNHFYGKEHSDKSKLKMSKWHKGRTLSDETKLKIGIKSKNRIRSEETKRKVRESILRRIRKFGKSGNYNLFACKYFDKLNKENGWNLQHALNGGEVECIGYSLDGYDKDKNIIVEYDEMHHKKPCIQKRDEMRQNRLINHLNCQFYRYREWDNKLVRII